MQCANLQYEQTWRKKTHTDSTHETADVKAPPRLEERERTRIWDFFAKLLHCIPSSPDSDYASICDAWRDVAAADWVWLWLLDQKSSAKQTVMQFGAASTSSPQLKPHMLRIPNTRSLAAYSAESETIVDVTDPQHWRKRFRGKVYRVEFAKELADVYACERVVCVPLMLPDSGNLSIRGSVSLCFKTRRIAFEYPAVFLDMMGRLTAQILLNSHHALQRTILLALDQLAHQYLTSGAPDLIEARSNYLHEVILMIRDKLRADCVSIFYRDTFRGGVQCLASTGLLWGTEGTKVDDLSEVNYLPNKGYVGRCYSTGEPQLLFTGLSSSDKPYTVESIDNLLRFDIPSVVYPIPLATTATPTREAKALGVIRCSYHSSAFYAASAVSMNPLELETLDFVARQIAPVLETMELNISRERAVSATKHDLEAPLGMIKHKARHLRSLGSPPAGGESEYISVNRYDILDIRRCAILSLNLVAQLDADLSTVPDVVPSRLDLVANVIAPMKNMFARYASNKNQMSIHFDGFTDFPELWLDEDLVQRALFNLMTNAIKYGARGTEVLLLGRKGQRGYNMDVQNKGVGVEANEEDLIFVPGYRSPHTKTLKIGLGLGLPLARACIEKCGGSLYLLARKNPTVFTIFLPKELQRAPLAPKNQ